MSVELQGLLNQAADAAAFGDRPRLLGLFKRIRDLLGELDPEKAADAIQKIIDWFVANPAILELLKGWFGAKLPAVSAASVTALSVEEIEAAGILDNAAGWSRFFQLAWALWKLFT